MTRNLAFGALLVASLISAEPASAACDNGGPKWLWSSTSDLVNRSTQALAMGQPARAARFAETVLANRLSPADTRIARHNLCLVSLAAGGAANKNADCAAALAGSEPAALLCGPSLSAATKLQPDAVSSVIAANLSAGGPAGESVAAVVAPR